jgi:hypothetical protein
MIETYRRRQPAPRSTVALAAGLLLLAPACQRGASSGPASGAASPEQAVADAVYTVLSADREAYTQEVVHRLQNQEKVLKASEHWKEEKLLPLPAQMFRMGAERVRKKNTGLSYALLSLWPINKQNLPRTPAEKAGLEAVSGAAPRWQGEETLGGARYFTAVYPDKAISSACVTCHNGHSESPRTDFKEGDVMGAIVIRVAVR